MGQDLKRHAIRQDKKDRANHGLCFCFGERALKGLIKR